MIAVDGNCRFLIHRWPRCAGRRIAPWGGVALARVDDHGRSQADRHSVRVNEPGVLGDWRYRSIAHAVPVARAQQRFVGAGYIQSTVHDARHHDGVFRGHADLDRRGQLSGAADDRRTRHGLSAAQRVWLLDHAVRRHAGVLQFRHRRRSGDRLVCLCSIDRTHFCPQRRHRFLGLGIVDQRHRHGHGRGELHCHDPGHARAGHDHAQDALLRLDHAVDRIPDGAGAAAADRRAGDDLVRSATRARTSSTPPTAARPFSGNTCSGSSGIRRCTSSSCRCSASCRRSCRCSRARCSSATSSWRPPPWPSPSSAWAYGPTICIAWA